MASATPGPSPTPLPPTITPTPQTGTTEICVLLYEDLNGDALHQTTEPVLLGGAISVTEINGKYSKTLDTAINPDPNAYPGTCFVDVPEGSYNIGAAIPDNYNPTMSLTMRHRRKGRRYCLGSFWRATKGCPGGSEWRRRQRKRPFSLAGLPWRCAVVSRPGPRLVCAPPSGSGKQTQTQRIIEKVILSVTT